MSTIYTYSRARQNLASLLAEALTQGEVKIKSRDGRVFIIRPERAAGDSPLAVEGVDLGLTSAEIVTFIKEGRERYGR